MRINLTKIRELYEKPFWIELGDYIVRYYPLSNSIEQLLSIETNTKIIFQYNPITKQIYYSQLFINYLFIVYDELFYIDCYKYTHNIINKHFKITPLFFKPCRNYEDYYETEYI